MAMKLNPDRVGEFDELDINAFSLKPDAIIYFSIAQTLGIYNKGITQGMSFTNLIMLKVLSVDELEILCEAQNYLKPDLKKEDGTPLDEYYVKLREIEKKVLGTPEAPIKFANDFDRWIAKSQVANYKLRTILKRVFKSSDRFKELQY